MLALATQAADTEPSAKPARPLPELRVSPARGLVEAPFQLKLEAAADQDAVIRFTRDFSEPTLQNGSEYSGPLTVTNTTIVRAAAFNSRSRVSAIATHSYIFLDQVIRQPPNPPGLTVGPRAWNGFPAAYGMDPRVANDPLYRDRMKPALQSLPTLSIVCRSEDLFGPRAGLYLHAEERGEIWERPCSAELILPDGSKGFQVDCGLRTQGNSTRMAMKTPKHAFRLTFKEKFGQSKLKYPIFPDSTVAKFDTLVLRADFNVSWLHWDAGARPQSQRIRDAWTKDSHRAMGGLAGHNRYVHLYLNGLYWGVYDVAERLDASFAASYLGGTKNDYDVVNEYQVKDGTMDGFNALQSVHGVANRSAYRRLQQLLDVPEFIDYLLLNYYVGSRDWGDSKNWYTIRRRTPPGPFQFLVWDAEQVLLDANDDMLSSPYLPPFRLAEELAANAEFKLAFADRVQKHFFNGGALTPAATAERWMKRAREVDLAIIAESARWGYYRRNPPFTRDRDWLAEQRRLLKNYFPVRTAIVLDQLRAAGLYPKIAAPEFNQQGGPAPDGFKLTLTARDGGVIYYTTDGFDPCVPATGAVSPHAKTYSSPVSFQNSATVKARVLKQDTWSALVEAPFATTRTEAVK